MLTSAVRVSAERIHSDAARRRRVYRAEANTACISRNILNIYIYVPRNQRVLRTRAPRQLIRRRGRMSGQTLYSRLQGAGDSRAHDRSGGAPRVRPGAVQPRAAGGRVRRSPGAGAPRSRLSGMSLRGSELALRHGRELADSGVVRVRVPARTCDPRAHGAAGDGSAAGTCLWTVESLARATRDAL